MQLKEPRDARKNWQDEYNKWWNKANGNRQKETPSQVPAENENSGGETD
jgi:hypothetical protein